MRRDGADKGAVNVGESHDREDPRSLLDGALLAGISSIGEALSVDFPAGPPRYPRAVVVGLERIDDDARTAAVAALTALGYAESELAFVAVGDGTGSDAVRTVLDVLDPESVITVDSGGADAVVAALPAATGGDDALRVASGRRIVHLGDLAASLGSETTKREVWKRFKLVSPRGPVY